MTPEQLDEIEKLAEAATPGPWEPCIGVNYGMTAKYYACGPYHVSREFDDSPLPSLDDGNGKERAEADARFIVVMRRCALPLVKALREAWARCETLRDLADEKAHAEGLYARRMEQAQQARAEARAEAERLRQKIKEPA